MFQVDQRFVVKRMTTATSGEGFFVGTYGATAISSTSFFQIAPWHNATTVFMMIIGVPHVFWRDDGVSLVVFTPRLMSRMFAGGQGFVVKGFLATDCRVWFFLVAFRTSTISSVPLFQATHQKSAAIVGCVVLGVAHVGLLFPSRSP
jgi:hypothetical protein